MSRDTHSLRTRPARSRGSALTLRSPGLALVAALPLVVACAGNAKADRDGGSAAADTPPVAVRVAPVSSEPARTSIEVTGVVASKSEVPLGFKIGGVVAELSVDEGDSVTRGQTLARLELDEIDGRLNQARVALEQAERDLARVRGLHQDGAATAEELEKTETALRLATSDLEIAAFNHDHATIRSPVAGWVLRRAAEPGQLVGAAEPVLVVGSAESGWVVRVGLADRDVVRIARGDRAAVELAALPEAVVAGVVTQIAETADTRTGTFEVELRIAADPSVRRRIKSGFVARATLTPETGSATPSVPIEALVRADGREGLVYGVEPDTGRFWPVPIRVEGFAGDRLLVRSGLDEVAWVVTDGADRLTGESRLDIRGRSDQELTASGPPENPRREPVDRPETAP